MKTKLTTKDLLECISVLSIIALLLFVAHNAKADTDIYMKIGAGYIISQPSSVKYNDDTIKLDLHYSEFSAHIESGFKTDQWSYGIHYANGKGDFHDPSKLEIFIDYDWIENSKWELITGIGYKLMYQDYTVYEGNKIKYNNNKSG